MKAILWNTLRGSAGYLIAIAVVCAMALFVNRVAAESAPSATTVVNEAETQGVVFEERTVPGKTYWYDDDGTLEIVDNQTGETTVVADTAALSLADRPVLLVQAAPAADTDIVYTDESGAPLPSPIKPGDEVKTAVTSFSELRDFAATGQWGLFASGILSLILLIFATLLDRSDAFCKWVKPHMAYVVMALPMIGCLIIEFASIPAGAGAGDWGAALWAGAQVGGNSMVFYHLVWKKWLRPLARRLWAWVKSKKADQE